MLAKARKLKLDEVKAAEEMRLQRKRQKRNEHTKARCVRREQRDRTTGKDSRTPDGTEGLFLPDRRVEPHIFMAPTLAVVQRGKGITKLAHQWVGPAKVVQDAGFDNVEVVRDDTGGHLVTHSSFLVASSCPSDSLGAIAERILAELAKEDDEAENVSPENERRESVAPLREEDHSAEVGRGRRGVAVPAHAAGPEPGAVGRTEDAATLERVGEVDIGQDGEASDLPARVAGSAQQPAVTAANATPEPMNPIIVTSGSNVGENLPVGPVTQRQATGGSKQRKRKPRPGSDVNNGEKQELQKRQEVDTAREARLARRQAARNEQKAPAVEEMGPDDGRGLHGGGHAETPGSKGNDRTKAGHGASRQQ
ncbi:hypothetical protein PF007_g11575 [Phytophthora fragariae]|uniref:Uncharacterized protein n=1 Tax=Phytophthora fragariae TaxID=53985 RepID=A0A6A3S6Z8_9STRA|nr:hypothetical protein PF007_g11575 [Phytophthora fragariae]